MARAKPIAARQYTYTAVFNPVAEGGHVVTFPALPGLVIEGETLEDARRMAEDALRCYLEGHLEDGLPIFLEEEASPAAVRRTIREPRHGRARARMSCPGDADRVSLRQCTRRSEPMLPS